MQSVRPATLGPASVLTAALVVGCLPTIPPVPDDAFERLQGQGYSLRVSEPPPGATRPAVLLDRVRQSNFMPAAASQQPLGPATYVVLTCVVPSMRGCGGDPLGAWVISFPGLGSMSVSWIVVDMNGRVMESGGR